MRSSHTACVCVGQVLTRLEDILDEGGVALLNCPGGTLWFTAAQAPPALLGGQAALRRHVEPVEPRLGHPRRHRDGAGPRPTTP